MRGNSTLCSAFALGSRLNVWKTNPISLFRMCARSSSDKSLTFCPLSQYSPAVGVSRDRKSTRLNSSHVEISYAVFCLKKKKKKRKLIKTVKKKKKTNII